MITRISAHFLLAEVLRNSGVSALPDDVWPDAIAHARVLEEARRILGDREIIPSSWYRPPAKNEDVGGSPTSKHPRARATDFTVKGLSPRDVMIRLAPYASQIGIDQLIEYPTHVHIGTSATSPRGQLLIALGGGKFAPWTSTSPSPLPIVATEPGTPTPKKWSIAWWLVILAGAAEIVRHLTAK